MTTPTTGHCISCGKALNDLQDIHYDGECVLCASSHGNNEAIGDLSYDTKEAIYSAVHDLVDKMTSQLPLSVDENVRQQLTEQFRFWRRDARKENRTERT